MLSSRPRQPGAVRIESAKEWLKVRLGRGAQLSFEDVHAAARIWSGGLDDPGERYYEEPLRRLIDATREADVTAGGRRYVWNQIVASLARRFRLVDEKQRAPHVFAAELRRPFLVMGLARSGTTHLHRLLAVDDRFSGIPAWELANPFPPADGPDRRREMAWTWYEQRRSDTDNIHFGDPDSPEECTLLLTSSFVSGLYWGGAPLYDYAEWLLEVGTELDERVYADHRDYLLHLQSRPGRSALALKSPDHTARLAAVDRVLPEAMIVHTVRDPVAATNSSQSLVYHYHRRTARRLDVARTANLNLRLIERGLQMHLRARETSTPAIIDVHYHDLVHRPIDVVRSIYEFHGVEWPADHEARLQEHLDANPAGKHGSHTYRSEDFGLTDDEIRHRFADYYDYFGIGPSR
jgi:hypothetical protein